MRLAEFIRKNHAAIEHEWEAFARDIQPTADTMTALELKDHIAQILDAIADDLDQPQTGVEQADKSRGEGQAHRMGPVGHIHATLRIGFGFKLNQLAAEYRALRATVMRLWEKQGTAADPREITRFHEAIDEALMEATTGFTETMDRYREQFLAILGHDLRIPLAATKALASLLSRAEELSDKHARLASRIVSSSDRMARMVGDLLDLTRTHLGDGIPIVRGPVDLELLCRDSIVELEASNPDRRVELEAEGDLYGEWDRDRLSQVVGNLVGNALQHADRDSTITVHARGEPHQVVLEVHNDGVPIPAEALPTLFDPMVSHPSRSSGDGSSLGLGLYIAREVVEAHGGRLDVTSTVREGTTFKLVVPRGAPGSERSGARIGQPPQRADQVPPASVH